MSIIAISRGTFSGGQAVAEYVANRLGYPCVSREEIATGITWYGVAAGESSDVSAGSLLLRERLGGERVAYQNSFRAALCELARSGNLVYHGHMAHLLLAGISHVLCVRVVADMEYRIASVMAQLHFDRQGAISYIAKMDGERMEWTRFLYGVEWDDPSLYDVVLNLSRLSVAGAGETLARMAALDEYTPTTESLKFAERLAVSSRVAAALARDPRTSASELNVAFEDGTATVTGTVRQPEVVESIPAVARTVTGVVSVRCDVKYVPEPSEAAA